MGDIPDLHEPWNGLALFNTTNYRLDSRIMAAIADYIKTVLNDGYSFRVVPLSEYLAMPTPRPDNVVYLTTD